MSAPGRRVAALAPYSLPGFTEVDVAAELSGALGRAVPVANDVKLAALAEHWKGAARDHDDIVYMFAGHRAGAGVLIGGQVHQGRHGAAGEIGALPMLGWESVVARLHARGAELAAAGDPARPRGRAGDRLRGPAGPGQPGGADRVRRGAGPWCGRSWRWRSTRRWSCSAAGCPAAARSWPSLFRRELAKLTLVPFEVVTSTMGADSVALGAARLALDAVLEDLLAVPGR